MHLISELRFYLWRFVSEKLSIMKNLHPILEFITTSITRKMHEFSEDFLEFVHLLIHLANTCCSPSMWQTTCGALQIKYELKISQKSYSHRIYILIWNMASENGQDVNNHAWKSKYKLSEASLVRGAGGGEVSEPQRLRTISLNIRILDNKWVKTGTEVPLSLLRPIGIPIN